MEIYLIRHTRVALSLEYSYGASDISLHSEYIEDFKNVKEKINNLKNFEIHSSPLSRCKNLAEYLFPNEKIHFDDRLVEFNFGDWELKKWSDIPKTEFDLWKEDFVNNKVPNGDSYFEVSNRVNQFIKEKILINENNKLITAHGGIIRPIISHFLGLGLENSFKLKIDYGSISKIKIEGELIRLEFLNL